MDRRMGLMLVCVAAWCGAPAQWATCHEPPVRVPDAKAHKPSPLPDRIILTWKSDPATSAAVTWRTDETVSKAVAQIAPAEGGPLFVKNAKEFIGSTVDFDSDLGHAHMHSVEFTELKPKTKYAYRVGDGVNWSEWFHLQTAATTAEPFSFIYFGDAQNDLKSMWSRVIREAFRDAPRAAFMIHAGDLINNADNDAQWGEWHRAGGWVNAMIPSIPTPGNHEYGRDPKTPLKSRLSLHWKPQFTLPENGPDRLKESTYFIDYQGVRIISLNSNELQEEQIPWLENALKTNPNQWTVCTFHHPIHSTAKGRDNPKLRNAWQPIFDKYRVDLVLTGHDHTYGRTGLEAFTRNADSGEVAQSTEGGTVYVVSVSGPKMYNAKNEGNKMKRLAEDTQLYQVISIDGGTLKYQARTAVGDLYDGFTLKKRPGKVNELIEQIPGTPQRLRLEKPAAVPTAKPMTDPAIKVPVPTVPPAAPSIQ